MSPGAMSFDDRLDEINSDPIMDPLDGWGGEFDDPWSDYPVDEDEAYFLEVMRFERLLRPKRSSKHVCMAGPEFDRRIRQLAKSWNCDPHTAECIMAGNEHMLQRLFVRETLYGERVPNRGRPPQRLFPNPIKSPPRLED